MKRKLVTYLLALTACLSAVAEMRFVLPKKATEAVFSPDGTRLAFQQDVGGRYALGIFELAGGNVTWIENESGQACHPAWGGNGVVVYTCCPEEKTAYSWYTNQTDVGYNLWAWKNGQKRRLTTGRCLDTTPSVSPDGRTVYFASNRGGTSAHYTGSTGNMGMFALPVEDDAMPVALRTFPNDANGAAVSQPQVSPDGRYLLWAEKGEFGENWHLMLAKVVSPNACARLTPMTMAAYAPRWCRQGACIVFTGFRTGDEGWGVYLLEPKDGAMKRICTGREGAVSPDGQTLVYENAAGNLECRKIAASEWPIGGRDNAGSDALPTEKVLWRGTEPKRATRIPLDPSFVSGTEDVLFVRAEVEFLETLPKFEHLFVAMYQESAGSGLQLYLTGGKVWFASRWTNNRYDEYVGVNTGDKAVSPGYKGTITGIRTREAIYLQVEGYELVSCNLNGMGLKLNTPQAFQVGHPANEGLSSRPFSGKIHKLEYGTGWPKNVRRDLTAKEVLE